MKAEGFSLQITLRRGGPYNDILCSIINLNVFISYEDDIYFKLGINILERNLKLMCCIQGAVINSVRHRVTELFGRRMASLLTGMINLR